jgi:hypothetical protein
VELTLNTLRDGEVVSLSQVDANQLALLIDKVLGDHYAGRLATKGIDMAAVERAASALSRFADGAAAVVQTEIVTQQEVATRTREVLTVAMKLTPGGELPLDDINFNPKDTHLIEVEMCGTDNRNAALHAAIDYLGEHFKIDIENDWDLDLRVVPPGMKIPAGSKFVARIEVPHPEVAEIDYLIPARLQLEGGATSVTFDASGWFQGAANEDLAELISENFAADVLHDVAEWGSVNNPDVATALNRIQGDKIPFNLGIDPEMARIWVWKNRPEMIPMLQKAAPEFAFH